MNITVKYFAQIGEWLDCREETLAVEPAAGQAVTARQILMALAARHGSVFSSRIYDPVSDNLHDDIFVLVNGCHLVRLKYLDTTVQDQDFLAIIPVAEAG